MPHWTLTISFLPVLSFPSFPLILFFVSFDGMWKPPARCSPSRRSPSTAAVSPGMSHYARSEPCPELDGIPVQRREISICGPRYSTAASVAFHDQSCHEDASHGSEVATKRGRSALAPARVTQVISRQISRRCRTVQNHASTAYASIKELGNSHPRCSAPMQEIVFVDNLHPNRPQPKRRGPVWTPRMGLLRAKT